ncbi:MAG: hypothetical protein PHG86_03405 [Candidatus Methanomethylophilaceae archaeon]|nr:hypothetical protein [Candidatus Methanomethylophilaceae archaeon]
MIEIQNNRSFDLTRDFSVDADTIGAVRAIVVHGLSSTISFGVCEEIYSHFALRMNPFAIIHNPVNITAITKKC